MRIKSKVARRMIFGALLITALLLVVFADAVLGSGKYIVLPGELRASGFAIILTVLAIAGAGELNRMVRAKGCYVNVYLVAVAIAALITEPVWGGYWDVYLAAGVFFMFLLLAGVLQAVKLGIVGSIGNLAASCLIVVYLGFGGSFLVKIRLFGADSCNILGQVFPILMFLATVKSADIGAYFTGRFLGRHKWAPRISAGKTWEGFFGGIILAVIVSSLFAYFSGIISIVAALIFGVVIATTGQLGDLLESMFKRDADIKDSGALVPEFGGLLDMLDSPLVAAPFAYLMFRLWIY